jgi:hypothetical protein
MLLRNDVSVPVHQLFSVVSVNAALYTDRPNPPHPPFLGHALRAPLPLLVCITTKGTFGNDMDARQVGRGVLLPNIPTVYNS